jgi:hypothetical protein
MPTIRSNAHDSRSLAKFNTPDQTKVDVGYFFPQSDRAGLFH